MEHSEKQVKNFKTQEKKLKVLAKSHGILAENTTTKRAISETESLGDTLQNCGQKVYFNKVMLGIPFGILQQSPCQHNVFLISVTFLTMYHRR